MKVSTSVNSTVVEVQTYISQQYSGGGTDLHQSTVLTGEGVYISQQYSGGGTDLHQSTVLTGEGVYISQQYSGGGTNLHQSTVQWWRYRPTSVNSTDW